MKAWGGSLALALLLAVALPVEAVLAAESAEEVLLDKANYWRIKDRPDLAAESLNKLLEINPNNPEALYQYGMLSVQQNKTAEAQKYLARLQQAVPDSPHVADLQNAIRAGSVGATDLSEARRLAQAGQLDDAVKKYKEIFKGPPPSEYAVEYYMTLAGTAQGWDEARQGLEKAAQRSPNDAQLKLSMAQLYTYREQTRVQGIALLAQLSKNPVVSAQAIQSWRQALTWLSGSPQAKPALQQYLAQFPQDQEIAQLLADLAKQPAGGGTAAQSQAYEDLKRGNTVAAERQFLADLKANPNDPQALAGLGLVRLRQQRFGEARDLLGKAIKLAPDQQKDFAPAYESAVFWGRVDEAKRLAAAKNYAGARAILASLLAHPRGDQWGALMVLGDIETKMGQNAAAEATYRQVLRARPGNIDATVGLAAALRAQSKTAEVDQLISRMSPAERARFEKAGTGGGGPAEALRNEAKAASANGDVATATTKFQAAIAADPKNPWIRLDYARFLAGQSHMPEAFAAVDPGASGNTPTSKLVAAMFDAQQDRWVQALDKINSVPVNQRTEDIKNFRDRIYVRGMIERAKQLAASGNTAQARDILVQLYQDKSVTTDEKLQAPFVIVDTLHDYPTALQITRDAYTKGGPDSVKAGGDYAMLLIMQGGHDDEAAKVMEQVNASGLVNASNKEQLIPVYTAIAIRRADKLRQHGDYAGAYDQISQLLVDNPDDTGLLMEEGRIFASAGRSKEAMEYFDKAYQQDSGNIDVVRGVVMGAILAHRLDQAQTYLDKGMEADPNNAWFYYLKAQIAEARGNNGAAIQALRTARALNRQQNPGAAAPAASDTTSPTPLTPGGTTGSPPPNPFRHSQLTLPGSTAATMAAATDDPLGAGRSAQI